MIKHASSVQTKVTATVRTRKHAHAFVIDAVAKLVDDLGVTDVVLCYSGGLASCVCAALLEQAVGERLTCLFMDHGLTRNGEVERTTCVFNKLFGPTRMEVLNVADQVLDALDGAQSDNDKQRSIGTALERALWEYISKHGGEVTVVMGTTDPESVRKSHHSVSVIPDERETRIIEPVRYLRREELIAVGKELGLPAAVVERAPTLTADLALRCDGAVTRSRLEALRETDEIICDEAGSWARQHTS